jgi:hypothetical protein
MDRDGKVELQDLEVHDVEANWQRLFAVDDTASGVSGATLRVAVGSNDLRVNIQAELRPLDESMVGGILVDAAGNPVDELADAVDDGGTPDDFSDDGIWFQPFQGFQGLAGFYYAYVGEDGSYVSNGAWVSITVALEDSLDAEGTQLFSLRGNGDGVTQLSEADSLLGANGGTSEQAAPVSAAEGEVEPADGAQATLTRRRAGQLDAQATGEPPIEGPVRQAANLVAKSAVPRDRNDPVLRGEFSDHVKMSVPLSVTRSLVEQFAVTAVDAIFAGAAREEIWRTPIPVPVTAGFGPAAVRGDGGLYARMLSASETTAPIADVVLKVAATGRGSIDACFHGSDVVPPWETCVSGELDLSDLLECV